MKILTSLFLLCSTITPVVAAPTAMPTINYAYCGYKASEDTIPFIQSCILLSPTEGDNTSAIQHAIHLVEQLTPDPQGFRGVVQLSEGTFTLNGRLQIKQSGVILRGMGASKTKLVFQGVNREPAISFQGRADYTTPTDTLWLTGKVSAGDLSLTTLKDITQLKAGSEMKLSIRVHLNGLNTMAARNMAAG